MGKESDHLVRLTHVSYEVGETVDVTKLDSDPREPRPQNLVGGGKRSGDTPRVWSRQEKERRPNKKGQTPYRR